MEMKKMMTGHRTYFVGVLFEPLFLRDVSMIETIHRVLFRPKNFVHSFPVISQKLGVVVNLYCHYD
jgi:hypothetical protein